MYTVHAESPALRALLHLLSYVCTLFAITRYRFTASVGSRCRFGRRPETDAT